MTENKTQYKSTRTIKYLKITFYVLFGILSLFVTAEIILNKSTKTTFDKLDETDREMLRLLSLEYKTFKERSDEIWNSDFRLDTLPFIAVRTGKSSGIGGSYAYVLNCGEMGEMINAKEIEMPAELHLPKVYRINKLAFIFSEILLPYNFGTIDFKSKNTFYFKYYPQMIADPVYGMDFSSFSIHEAFHVFKQEKWRYDEDGKFFISDYPNEKEQYALLGLEFKILDKALYNTDIGEVNKLMEQWLLVRNERYTKWPSLLTETFIEAIEGTAQYTQYQYSKLIGGHIMILGTKGEPYHISFEQAFDFVSKGQGKPGFLDRGVYYETGAALGMIMDNLGIDWKIMIEDSKENPGKTQYAILRDHYNSTKTEDTENVLEELKIQYDYDDLLVKGQEISRRNINF